MVTCTRAFPHSGQTDCKIQVYLLVFYEPQDLNLVRYLNSNLGLFQLSKHHKTGKILREELSAWMIWYIVPSWDLCKYLSLYQGNSSRQNFFFLYDYNWSLRITEKAAVLTCSFISCAQYGGIIYTFNLCRICWNPTKIF